MSNYISLDVETANSDKSSICQIGMAVFENSKLIEKKYFLVDPRDYFDDFNVGIHGITP